MVKWRVAVRLRIQIDEGIDADEVESLRDYLTTFSSMTTEIVGRMSDVSVQHTYTFFMLLRFFYARHAYRLLMFETLSRLFCPI